MLADCFEIIDPRFRKLVLANVQVEQLWTGGRWAEGPTYVPAGRFVLFSDIPNDRVMRFDEISGATSARLRFAVGVPTAKSCCPV